MALLHLYSLSLSLGLWGRKAIFRYSYLSLYNLYKMSGKIMRYQKSKGKTQCPYKELFIGIRPCLRQWNNVQGTYMTRIDLLKASAKKADT